MFESRKKPFVFILTLLLIFDTAFSQQTQLIINRGHSDFVTSVNNAANGKTFVTASYDGFIKIWDSETKCELSSIFVGLYLVGAKFCRHDSLIVAFTGKKIFVVNVIDGLILRTLDAEDGVEAVEIFNNDIIYVTHSTGLIIKVGLEPGDRQVILFSNFDKAIYSAHPEYQENLTQAIAVAADSGILFSVSNYTNEIIVYNLIKNIRKSISLGDKNAVSPKRTLVINEIEHLIYFQNGNAITAIKYAPAGKEGLQYNQFIGDNLFTSLVHDPVNNKLFAVGPSDNKVYIVDSNGITDTALILNTGSKIRLLSVQYVSTRQEILVGGSDGSLWSLDPRSLASHIISGRLAWITNIFSNYDSNELMLAIPGASGYDIERRDKKSLQIIQRDVDLRFDAFLPLSRDRILGIRNNNLSIYVRGKTWSSSYYAPLLFCHSADSTSQGSDIFDVNFTYFSKSNNGNIYFYFHNDSLNQVHYINTNQLGRFQPDIERGHYMSLEDNIINLKAATSLNGIKISENDVYLLVSDIQNNLYYVKPKTGEILKMGFGKDEIRDFGFFSDGVGFYIATLSGLYTCSNRLSSVNRVMSFDKDAAGVVYPRILLTDSNEIIISGIDSTINKITLDNTHTYIVSKEPIIKIPAKIFSMSFYCNQDRMLIGCLDNSFSVIDLKSKSLVVNAFPGTVDDETGITTENRVFVLKNGLYFKPKSVSSTSLFIKKGDAISPMDFYGVYFNRPDAVLAALDTKSNKTAIAFYKKLHEKQLQALGLPDVSLERVIPKLPFVNILNKKAIPTSTVNGTLDIEVEVGSKGEPVKNIIVLINGCSASYQSKLSGHNKNANRITKIVSVKLSCGVNEIELFCVNTRGLESLRAQLFIVYSPVTKPAQPKTYILTIGLTKYRDKRYNLKTAAADCAELLWLFRTFNKPYIMEDSLIDENATKENILALLHKYTSLDIDDNLIIYYGGHGLLDNKLDYYLSGFKTNFESIAEGSILYRDLIKVLKTIPCRKKLVLIDACHSREIPKDFLNELDRVNRENPIIEGTFKCNEVLNMFEEQDNVSGIEIIGASENNELAEEDLTANHSYFMQGILSALAPGGDNANFNKDNSITLQELKKYLLSYVAYISSGRQTPIIINNNVHTDNWILSTDQPLPSDHR